MVQSHRESGGTTDICQRPGSAGGKLSKTKTAPATQSGAALEPDPNCEEDVAGAPRSSCATRSFPPGLWVMKQSKREIESGGVVQNAVPHSLAGRWSPRR